VAPPAIACMTPISLIHKIPAKYLRNENQENVDVLRFDRLAKMGENEGWA
jgi:hypothetical protein